MSLKSITALVLGLATSFITTQAQADCYKVYANAQTTWEATVREIGADAGEAAILTITTALPALVISSTVEGFNNNKKALNLLSDAKNGEGLVLQEFARDSGLSVSEAAAKVNELSEKNVICTNFLYSYDQIVTLAKGR